MNTSIERETKFDVTQDFQLPDPERLVGQAREADRSEVSLRSTYYDTADRALLRQHITLRRREGDIDTGWHLKVPSGAARTEVRLPLAAGSDVPDQLGALVKGVALGAALEPVALIKTARRLIRVRNGNEVLLEIADDEVHGTALGASLTTTNWREVEVELGPAGDEKLLDAVGKKLVKAGAEPSSSSSKLARTLEWNGASPQDEPVPHALVRSYLSEQSDVIVAGDVALRRGLEPVHKTRVAVRRFRSVLRVFAWTFSDQDAARNLDAELSWYQDLLGAVRDSQVQRARFAEALEQLPDELVLGPVAATIDQVLLREQIRGRTEVGAALESTRYFDLLRTVLAWSQDPPLRPDVEAGDLTRLARKARRQAGKRLKAGLDDPSQLHRARKAAKRARYATELLAPVTGGSKRTVKAYKHAQDVLGEHQDSVLAADLVRRLGAAASADPEQNGFTYGLLYEREQLAAAHALKAARRLDF